MKTRSVVWMGLLVLTLSIPAWSATLAYYRMETSSGVDIGPGGDVRYVSPPMDDLTGNNPMTYSGEQGDFAGQFRYDGRPGQFPGPVVLNPDSLDATHGLNQYAGGFNAYANGYGASGLTSYTLNGSTSVTVEAWVTGWDHRNRFVIAQEDTEGAWGRFGWMLGINSNDQPYFDAFKAGVGDDWAVGAPLSNFLSTWHHVAAVYDAAAQEVRLYVDGQLQSEAAALSAPSASDTNQPLYLGARWNGAYLMHGGIDEVRISSGALDPSQFLNAPEPATLFLLALGGLGLVRRRNCK